MKSKCCRSRPRCAMCPVVLAAGARAMQAPDDSDLFALLRAAPQPSCRRVSSMRSRGLTAGSEYPPPVTGREHSLRRAQLAKA